MKIFKSLYFYLFLVFLLAIISVIDSIGNTVLGGWKPPSTELILGKNELNWIKQVENKYVCSVDYIGLEDSYQEDSIIYITINFKDDSKLLPILNDSIESLTQKLAQSFITSSKKPRKQKYILIAYDHEHHFNLDTLVKKIPMRRTCFYAVQQNKIYPTEKHLIFSQLNYYVLDTLNHTMKFNSIGRHKYNYVKNNTDQKFKVLPNKTFKKLKNCELYQESNFNTYEHKNFKMEYKFNYLFFENGCISTTILYQITPKTKEIFYKDLVDFLTKTNYSLNSKQERRKAYYSNYISEKNLNYEKKANGILIKSKVDTTHIPWKISYESSLDKIEFYRNGE